MVEEKQGPAINDRLTKPAKIDISFATFWFQFIINYDAYNSDC